jgi:hypothetical protein
VEASGFRVITYPNRDSEFRVYSIADIHWLNRGCSKDQLARDIQTIKDDEYALWVGVGDYCDWITPGHPHFDPLCLPPDFTFEDLARYAFCVSRAIINLFDPIKDKCIGFGFGNHEWNMMARKNQYEIHAEICRQLNVPDLWFGSFIDVYFVHNPHAKRVRIQDCPETGIPEKYTAKLTVVAFHGAGAPATAGGKMNRLKSLNDICIADLVIMGHPHEQLAKPFVRLTTNEECSEIKEKVTMGLITGSYLRGYMSGMVSYGERRGYSPTTIGATRARYIPSSRDLTVEVRAHNVGRKG